jgi:hypothetical protein
MVSKIIFIFGCFLIMVCPIALPMDRAPRSMEGYWNENGKKMEDTSNIKHKGYFGAQLWVISNKNFFDIWNTPETPKLNLVKKTVRNKDIFVVLMFTAPGADANGNADVVFDFLLKKPDGSAYADYKDLDAWHNKPVPKAGDIQLAVQDIGVKIEDNDPLGKYTVEVLVKDKIKGVELPLSYEFEVE